MCNLYIYSTKSDVAHLRERQICELLYMYVWSAFLVLALMSCGAIVLMLEARRFMANQHTMCMNTIANKIDGAAFTHTCVSAARPNPTQP
jgi:hypothetical protein